MAAGLVPLALLVSRLGAQQPSASDVEAAFLLNFTKFIEWPQNAFSDAASPFAICVIRQDPFGHTLDDMVAGETVGARKLVVRRLADAPAEPGACQVVFLGVPRDEARGILVRLGSGILTVGVGDASLREGAMVAFVIDNRRVRFDINQELAEKNGLKLSSRLLTVARSVRK